MFNRIFWLFAALLAMAIDLSAQEYQDVSSRSVSVTPNFQGGNSNQFTRVQGVYHGLILASTNVVPEYSGAFRIWVDSDRDYSGRLDIGDDTVWLRGRFNSQGQSAVLVYRRVWDDCFCFYELRLVWEVTLNLVPNSDELRGTVRNVRRGWTNEMAGYRGGGNAPGPLPFAGRYTLRLPTGADASIAPAGEGYASVAINRPGQISMVGALADGTPFSRSATISTNGFWPFFVPLNEGRGMVIGWLRIDPADTNHISGDLQWVRPVRSEARYYPAGYSGVIAATGSRYRAPAAGEDFLSFTTGILTIDGGNLTTPLANEATISSSGKITSNNTNFEVLSSRLNRATGIFRGKLVHPETNRRTSFSGIVDQEADLAAGYFLGTDQGGLIRLEAP